MRILLSALCLAGLVISILALRIHTMDPSQQPPCAVSEHWDCGAVNHSRFAVFPPRSFDEAPTSTKLHIPVATVGIIGYSLMLLAAIFGSWWVLLQLAEIGFGAACFLSYLEAYVMQKWCIYCVWSWSVVTAILLLTILALLLRRGELRSGERLRQPFTRSI